MHIHGGGLAMLGQSSQNGWTKTFKVNQLFSFTFFQSWEFSEFLNGKFRAVKCRIYTSAKTLIEVQEKQNFNEF